ncbi:MAG: hypothetical protein AAF236_06885 [Verrucomicrobiota bacterium]
MIDPQRLLTEQKSNDIKRFLEFHSDEADILIYAMIIGGDQEIPLDISLPKLHQDWFSDRPTVLMVYYREAPDQLKLVYNRAIEESLSESVFSRIRRSVVREGRGTDLAPDQVETMAIELSIQLYWLARLVEQGAGAPQGAGDAGVVGPVDLTSRGDAPELLREYAPMMFEEEGRALPLTVVIVLAAVGLMLVGLLAGFGMVAVRNRDELRGKPTLFPEFEISRRLGGEFSGGGFVGMSFQFSEGQNGGSVKF